MQDDTPWKPPADGDTDAGTEPDVASAAPTPASTSTTPTLAAPPPPPAGAMPAPGAPAVPSAVNPPPPSSPPPPGPSPAMSMPQSDGAVVTSSPTDDRSRRSKWLVAGAATSVFAVGAAGIFAVANLAGAPEGGADSPADLGLTLLDAIEQEDVLGVIDTLSPGEREVFRDPMVDLVDELTRLELLSPDADLARLLGVDVEFSNEAASEAPTNVGDIVNVDLRADATITFDGAEVPIGALITDNMPDDLLTELRGTRLTETDELDFRLTAVEQDGRWYFSVFHTIAELARADAAPGSLIPATGIGSDGAESPEAAFDNMLDQVEALDLTGMMRSLNPGEAAALQRYAPMFVEEAQTLLDDEVPLEWAITQREFRSDTSGDTATIFVDALAIEGAIDGEAFSLSFSDGCLRAEGMGESFAQCQSDTTAQTEEMLQDMPEAQRLLDTFTEAFSDMDEVGLEMRLHDGQWYVSPLTTMSEAMLAALRALDRSEIDALAEQFPPAFDEFTRGIFGGFGVPSLDSGAWETLDDDPLTTAEQAWEDIYELTSDEFTSDFALSVDEGELSAWDQCYAISDPAEASDCFFAASKTDGIDVEFIPLALRYPECNYMASWGGELYEMSDEQFTALAQQARPCFLDLVERGEVQEYELPTEIAYLECFEGRNWYNSFDDPDYDERYFACLEEAYAGE
ncbi:MAG: hypothetical protein HKN41_10075 [Ilumatobacter sp.]|nr:hypothetical protein [Ilumatobacter sp.]